MSMAKGPAAGRSQALATGSVHNIALATLERLARDLIANAIACFAAPTTQFVTGQILFVDGGTSRGEWGI